MGATPQRLAKAASLFRRAGLSPTVISSEAAVSVLTRQRPSTRGRLRPPADLELLVELMDLLTEVLVATSDRTQ
jgi:hypothetical protein